MAITLHRCNNVWVKVGGHPCERVQKALDEPGIEYKLATRPALPQKHQQRTRSAAGAAWHRRGDRAAHTREEVPVDRVRGRLDLPRGVEGDGAADQGRQA